VLAAGGYAAVRVLVAVIGWAFGTAVTPLAWQALLAAAVVEVVIAALAVAGGQLAAGASGSAARS
jgi:hypothetical protein